MPAAGPIPVTPVMIVLTVAFGFWPAIWTTRANCSIESIEIVQPAGVAMTQMFFSDSAACTVRVEPSTRATDVLRDRPIETTDPSPAPMSTPSETCDGWSVDVAEKEPSRTTWPKVLENVGQKA